MHASNATNYNNFNTATITVDETVMDEMKFGSVAHQTTYGIYIYCIELCIRFWYIQHPLQISIKT